MEEKKPTLLLHSCCAPCTTYVARKLGEDFDIALYFYNPNIHPEDEYRLRLEETRNYASKVGLTLVLGEYDPDRWFKSTEGYENEAEGGARCEICYRVRLERTAKYAKERGFEHFTTTLSISPHKKASVINSIGLELSKSCGPKFYSADFKKRDGFKISCQLSREYGLYRQDYCGCVFSKYERDRRVKNATGDRISTNG